MIFFFFSAVCGVFEEERGVEGKIRDVSTKGLVSQEARVAWGGEAVDPARVHAAGSPRAGRAIGISGDPASLGVSSRC